MLFENEIPEDEFLDGGYEIKSGKPRFSRLLTLLIATTLTIGTTLASNVSLGAGLKLEFGQGVQITSACDSDISAKPIAEYMNSVPKPGMYLKAFKLSGISQNCQDKLFILRAYPETGSALSMNSVDPAFSLKFHFTNLSWIQDMSGCLFFNNVVLGSSTNNAVDLELTGCVSNYNPPTNGRSDQPPLGSQAMYKFTLETRPNTIARIDLSTDYGNNALGWTFNTGDEITTSAIFNWTSYTAYADLAYGGRFNVYGKISDADYANGSAGPGIYTVTASAGITCTYSGKTDAGALISTGIFANYRTPSNFKAVVYECTATTSGTVALGYSLLSA